MMKTRIVKRGELYFANLGIGVGSEQAGERPVLIVQNDKGNYYSPTTIVLPLTTQIHKSKNLPVHVILDKLEELDQVSAVMAEQIVTIDKNRLKKRIGIISDEFVLRDIDRAMRISLDLITKYNRHHFQKS